MTTFFPKISLFFAFLDETKTEKGNEHVLLEDNYENTETFKRKLQ